MKIHEKVVRRQKNIDWNINNLIKKDILRKIEKDKEILKSKNITFGIEPLSTSNLTDFYKNLYIPIIGSKENAKLNNLLEIIDPHETSNNNRFLLFIRDGDILLGGGICNHINNVLRFSYKCNIKDSFNLSAWFGTLIDFLFFSFWIEKSVEYFTYWRDRNWYWALWADCWLCIHKLLLWFKPYSFSKNILIEIDEHTIKTPTIIFDEAKEDLELKKVVLLHRTKDKSSYVDILTKKWFIITYL